MKKPRFEIIALCAIVFCLCIVAAFKLPHNAASQINPEQINQKLALYSYSPSSTQYVEQEQKETITIEETMASQERYEAAIDELWLLQEAEVPLVETPLQNREQPIYSVYKCSDILRGQPETCGNCEEACFVEAPVEWQWFIWDLAEEHGIPESFIFGLITLESTWNPRTVNEQGPWIGLVQMSQYWKRAVTLSPYRLTDRHRDYDLYDPYDNLLSAMEMWLYGLDHYDIDPQTELGQLRLAYFHSTGNNPNNVTGIESHRRWYDSYGKFLFRFIDELVTIRMGGDKD